MNGFYLIGNECVLQSLDLLSVIEQIERAYVLKARGEGGVFPVITHEWVQGTKDMDIKAGYLDGSVNIYGLKALTYIEDNLKIGLPPLLGTMMIFDSTTGQLKGLIDSRGVTGYRTGAAGGIGSKYLARKDSETLLLVGAGNQAFFNLAANLLVMEHIKRVLVFDPANPNGAETFARTAPGRLRDEIFCKYQDQPGLLARLNISIEPVSSLEAATGQADIIVTVTPSRTPLIKREWVKAGTHFNCIGADMEGKEEVDPQIFGAARVVVDDLVQATTLGETEIPVKTGVIKKEDILCEIGSIVDGKVQGRVSPQDITLFDTTGLALQDLVTAEYLLQRAKQDNLPTYTL